MPECSVINCGKEWLLVSGVGSRSRFMVSMQCLSSERIFKLSCYFGNSELFRKIINSLSRQLLTKEKKFLKNYRKANVKSLPDKLSTDDRQLRD